MDDYSTSTTDPTQLNSLLGGGTGEPLIPDSMMTFIIVCFVIINILTIVFMIFWIMGMVRRWKVQGAILHMQKDIVEIKESLAKSAQVTPATEPIAADPAKTKASQQSEPASKPIFNEPPKPKSDTIASDEPTTNHIS